MQKVAVYNRALENQGGGERVTISLSNALSKYYDIHIINLYNNTFTYTTDFKNKIFFCHQKKARLRKYFFYDIIRTHRYFRNNKIDAVIIVGKYSYPVIPLLGSIGTGTKTIFFEQSTLNYPHDKMGFKEKIFSVVSQWIINMLSTHIITLTKKEMDLYCQRYKKIRNKISFIPNFCVSELENLPYYYNVKSKKIITVGRIEEEKGIKYILQVAKKIFEKHPDWSWDLYGKGTTTYVNKIKEYIIAEKLENNLFLKGPSDSIYSCYPQYSIEVLASKYEGFSLVLLEGKANYLPEVSFDIYSGPSDIIEDGVNGYLVTPYNLDMMAEKIIMLIEHPEIRIKFSKNAKSNMDKFLLNNVISRWNKLLESMLGWNLK